MAENMRNELWQNVVRSVQMNDILHHFGYMDILYTYVLFVSVRNFVSFSAHS